MRTALVVPTNRPNQFREFAAKWSGIGDWTELIVIEDAPTKTPDLTASPHHYSWQEIDEILGEDAWIISRQDSAIRCFGFLIALRIGADLVLTLDDDCRPIGKPIVAGHLAAMNGHKRWVSTTPDVRPRGLPYRNLGELDIMCNMGLWAGVPDQDAAQSLLNPVDNYSPAPGSRIIPAGQYCPVSGMNLFMKASAVPLFYFPLMGATQPFRRFDDIWAGVIAKKIMDHLGWHLAVGEPFIAHNRASDPYANLIKEAPGLARNESIWEEIDACQLTAGSYPVDCVRELGAQLESIGSDKYLRDVGRAMQVWAGLLQGTRISYVPPAPTDNNVPNGGVTDAVHAGDTA